MLAVSRYCPAIAVFLLTLCLFNVAEAATVSVTIQNIAPQPGAVRVALYGKSDGFRHEKHALQVLSAPAQTGSATLTFENIAPGRYALIAYHDANDNKKLDLMLGMFPEEGWGLSNNPHVTGPPSFDSAAFDVAEPGTKLAIQLHY